KIRIWDATTGKEIPHITDNQGSIGRPLFSPDGKALVSISYNLNTDTGVIEWWDVAAGKEIRKLPLAGAGDIAISSDGRTVAAIAEMPKTAKLRNVHLWNVATGKAQSFSVAQKDRMFTVAFSPDNRMLAWGTADG